MDIQNIEVHTQQFVQEVKKIVTEEDANLAKQVLLEKFKDLMRASIVDGKETSKAIKTSEREFVSRELADFIDKDGRVKQWLRARCLESVVASAGLEEYLNTLISFRGSSPSKMAPLNVLLVSNQISRALDPIAAKLLRDLQKKPNLAISKEKLNSLVTILSPTLDFSVSVNDVYFDVDEVERIRNLLLQIALEKMYSSMVEKELSEPFPRLRRIGKAPVFSFDRLALASERNSLLRVDFSRGILRWKYGTEPTIFLARGLCYCDQREIESGKTSYDLVKRQYYLMKKVLTDMKDAVEGSKKASRGT